MKILKKLLLAAFILIMGVFLNYHWVNFKTNPSLFNEVDVIPKNKVGILLGASKYMANGKLNYFYKYRVEAAVKLYKAGKIEYLLVSGDNGRTTYDEPTAFKKDLVAAGIPEQRIFLDFAGFRTLDSMIRAKEVFGQDAFTIISQEFHNQRALFIATQKGIIAVAFNAQDIRVNSKTHLREYLARVKMRIDLWINVQPKFLGKPIEIK